MATTAVILVVSFVALLLLNVPVAVAIGVATLLAIFSLGDVPASLVISQRMASGIDSVNLLAIPFFVLAGHLMGRGGMAKRLIDFADALVGWLPGGLAYVTTLTCMMFGAISGSASGAVSAIGSFMIPQMTSKGYPRDFSVALTTTAATTGLVIPPSNIMIVYGVVASNVSIAALFLAGVVPGIVIGLFIIVAAAMLCGIHGIGKVPEERNVQLWRATLTALPSLFLVIVVLGGILGGVVTATEASAVAVAYAYILGFWFYREVSHRDLPQILLESGKTTAIVMLLIGTSQSMSWLLAHEQIPQAVSEALLRWGESKLAVLLLINCVLLLVGTFMDMTPAVIIFTPIFLPVAMGLDVHPIHFGLIMIANLCIGLCTPPVGTCLFVGCSVGQISVAAASRRMIPFYIAMIMALAVITFVPQLSLFLPRITGWLD
ncbi:MAG: TRAP transporter large permease [Pirellulaceae bacterium]|nr:TRAP transporter large permease [Planctomycetales bacterium]